MCTVIRRRSTAIVAAVLAISALGTLASSAGAVGDRVRQGRAARPETTFVDVRAALSHRAARSRVGTLRAPGASTRAARSTLRRSLGRSAVLDVDAIAGTPRMFTRLNGAMTGPKSGAASDVAMTYVRGHLAALGLDSADVASLGAPERLAGPGGSKVVRWRQSFAGIPAYDGDLRVNVARDGRILAVYGSPRHALRVASTTPALSAGEALRALMDNVGVHRPAPATSGPTGARQTTRFAGGHRAELVLFGTAGVRLAWHLTYSATPTAMYDAVVDAVTGAVLRRANLVHFIDALVVPFHPGAAVGDQQIRFTFPAGWLADGSQTLSGPNVHAFADINDNDAPDAGEEVPPSNGTDFLYQFRDITSRNDVGNCDPDHQCAWDHTVPFSWQQNQRQGTVNAFFLANSFHDHLASAPIGFTAATGAFEGDDPLVLNSLDGANTDAGLPDPAHVNNANMSTLPDGQSPTMQMFLAKGTAELPDTDPDFSPFRDIDFDDDALTVYHEYTHGLVGRTITNADGVEAASSAHAGAMNEAWADWYAEDFAARQLQVVDDPAVVGEVALGEYSDFIPNSTRFQPYDCPVGTVADACPGGIGGAGTGGFTLGDFGKVFFGPEVHSDGEIWAETLWDLRAALIPALNGDQLAASDAAEERITGGMRLGPPEPSFLDARNAILQADLALGGQFHDLIWDVFSRRGMGFFAGAIDGSDTVPVEDFQAPPRAGTPTGAVTGAVTDAVSGLPVSGIKVGFAGHATDPTFAPFLASTTDGGGRYTIAGAPQGTYPKLNFAASRGFDPVTLANTQVVGNQTLTRDVAVRRDWAASGGGGTFTTNDDTGAEFGCGAAQAIDQSLGIGWSPFNPDSPNAPGPPDRGPGPPTLTVQLPATVTVTAFGVDPGNTCGDDPTSTTKDFRIETSTNGVAFTVAQEGAFVPGAAGHLNLLAPTAGATNVRFVRITLLSPQGAAPGDSGADFIDLSELEVFGAPPNALPSGPLVASPSPVTVGQAVQFDASGVRDPDSAITGYDWDFDGNGVVDRTTTASVTSFAFGTAGTFAARVAVRDFRGGAGTAAATVQVTAPGAAAQPGAGQPGAAQPGAGQPGAVQPAPAAGALAPPIARITSTRRRVVVRVQCAAGCAINGRMTVGRALARRLGLSRRTLASVTRRLVVAGRRNVALRLGAGVRTRLRARGVRRLRVTVRVRVNDTNGRSRTLRRTVTLRL